LEEVMQPEVLGTRRKLAVKGALVASLGATFLQSPTFAREGVHALRRDVMQRHGMWASSLVPVNRVGDGWLIQLLGTVTQVHTHTHTHTHTRIKETGNHKFCYRRRLWDCGNKLGAVAPGNAGSSPNGLLFID